MQSSNRQTPPQGDAPRVLASFTRGDAEEIRVTLNSFQGRRYLHVRQYYRAQDGSMRPTKQGAALRESEIATLASALDEALGVIEGREPEPDPTESWGR